MTIKFQNKYRIESNRWQYWNYSAPGSYFITICIEDREAILGKIINGKMHLSVFGEIVKNEFIQMGAYNNRAKVEEWIIMPNHVHCIITLGTVDVGPTTSVATNNIVEKIHEFSLRCMSEYNPIVNPYPPILKCKRHQGCIFTP